jgi:hypothetical protein
VACRAAVAHAAPELAALGFTRASGAEACITARDLALAVEQRLGRAALVSASQAERFIDGRVEALAPPATGFRVSVTVSDAKGAALGTRELEDPDPSCRALDEPIVLVVALLVDPEAARRAGPAAPALGVAPRPPPPPPAPPPAPAPEPWRASLALGPAFMVGLLPKAGAAASLRGEIVPPSFIPIEIGGAVWLGVDASAPTTPTASASVNLSYATLGLCPLVWRTARTTVRGCADVAVGALRASGQGFTATNTGGEAPFVEGMLAGRVTRRLVGPLELGVGLALAVPFTRPSFTYLDATRTAQQLVRVGPVAGVLDAAVGLAFP